MNAPATPLLPDTTWQVTAPFWEGTHRHELCFPRCECCGRFEWYPMPMCKHCHSREWTWVPVEPTATIYSFTVLRRSFLDGFEENVPYAVLQLQFAEAPGVTLVTGLADLDQLEQVAIGKQARIEFLDVDEQVTLPLALVLDAAPDSSATG